MKTTFTPNEIMSNRGCYERSDVKKLSFIDNSEINIDTILNSEIPIKDKLWFVRNNCEFTTLQKKLWFIGLAEITLEIYENKYPNNKAPREAIQAAKDYLNNLISKDELLIKRNNASASAYTASDAASAADYAADAADWETKGKRFQTALLVFTKDFINSNL